jgi:hypothetical protein
MLGILIGVMVMAALAARRDTPLPDPPPQGAREDGDISP